MSQKSQTILISIVLFYAFALPLILTDYNAGRAYGDQQMGHLPAIMFFAEQLDFSNYPSATTPGYHLLIAVFVKIFTKNIIFLKLVSSLITAVFIGVFAALLYEKAGKLKTIVLLLPMIFSLYILPDGVWLVPDNLAWLTVSLIFIIFAIRPLDAPDLICAGLVLLAAVAVRQSNLWLASIPWAAGLAYLLFDNPLKRKKIFLVVLAFLVTVPAFLLLFYFFTIWEGLVPPSVQGRHERGLSYCVPAFFLSIFFVYALFYTPIVIEAVKKHLTRRAYYCIVVSGIIGFFIAVIPATDYNHEVGRFSGFWNFVRLAPSIGHTSVLLTVTSSLGGVLLCCWLLLVKRKFRFILFMASIAFSLALVPNALVLERYFAGFVFILLLIILYKTDSVDWERLPNFVLIGPAVFTLISFLFLCRGVFMPS